MASNELKSLSKIFDGKYLRIPDYQRGYAWGEAQLKDFWDDLESLEDTQTHYTGVLTVEKVTQHMKNEKVEFWKKDIGAYNSDDAYYIVDGQQRITTMIICLQVLFNQFEKYKLKWIGEDKVITLKEKYLFATTPNGYNRYFFGYTTDNPSYEFLKTVIFGEKSSTNDNKETLYTVNLERAKTFFEEKIEKFKKEEIENIFSKITKNFKFNLYEISDDMDVFVAFETMNNRGKKLSNLELLKNRLIYLSTKFEDEEKIQLRDDINECWKTIYEYLGKNKNNPLNDDTFLKNHWIMYHDYSRKKGNDYIVDLLEERYTAKNVLQNKITIKEIKDYVQSLKDSVKHWYYLYNPEQSKYDDSIKVLLDKLYRLGYGAFAPLIMAIFTRDENYDIDKVSEVLKIMEKYIFLVFRVSQRRANTGDSDFFNNAREYYLNTIQLDDIIGTKNDAEDKYSGINWWLASYFDISQFYNYLNEKFEKREGYYSWNGLNYFLFEYELSLKSQNKNSEFKINWQDWISRKSDYISIEHIMPQSRKYDCWKDITNNLNDKEYKKLCNSLGNLVPLSCAKNSKLQNYCFNIKKDGKTDENLVGFKNGSYAEQEINEEKEKWTKDEIQIRGMKLLDFMANHWDINELKDKDEQLKYLFLK